MRLGADIFDEGYWLVYGVYGGLTLKKEKTMSQVTMRQMLEAGVHFGHRTRYWNPQMAPYIFGARKQMHIVNLEKTLPMFNDAMNYIGKLAADNKKVLFVGTKRAAKEAVRAHAERCGMPYVSQRWLGGTLTNFKTIKRSIQRMIDLEEILGKSEDYARTKKEMLMMGRELRKLNDSIGGIRDMGGMPDAMFVIDVGYEANAIREAVNLGIPVIGVVDTNCSQANVDYVIPGNDDSSSAINLYLQAAADAVLEGQLSGGDVSAAAAGSDDLVEVDESGIAVTEAVDTASK